MQNTVSPFRHQTLHCPRVRKTQKFRHVSHVLCAHCFVPVNSRLTELKTKYLIELGTQPITVHQWSKHVIVSANQ